MQVNFSQKPLSSIQQNPQPPKQAGLTETNKTDSFVRFSGEQSEALSYEKVKTIEDPVLGDIEMYQFSNGMEFYALKKEDVPLVSYGVVVKTGAANETVRTSGASHFLEHLIFKGSDKLAPGEGDKIVENLGGSSNAFTSWGETFYYAHDLPKDNLDRIIEVWTDLLANASIPQEELDRERHVVLEEINMYDNMPTDQVENNLLKMVWPDSRSHWRVLGSKRNIRNISRDEIMRFVKHYYDPSNQAVIVVGDFDTEKVLEKVRTEYENNPFTGEVSFQPLRPLTPATEATEMVFKKNVTQSQLFMGFRGPKPGADNFEKDFAALEVVSNIVGTGRSSRLYQELVETGLANDLMVMPFSTSTDSLVEMVVEFDPEQYDAVKEAMQESLAEIAENGVTDAEIDKAVLQLKLMTAGVGETQFETIRDMAKKVSHGRLEDSYGQRIEKHFDEITPADVQNVVNKYLTPENARISAMVPTKKALKQSGQIQFSGKLTPQDSSTTLDGGTEVITRKKQGLKTAVSVVLKSGRALDSVRGETLVLADLLQQGSANYTAAELNAILEEKGLVVGTEVSGDNFIITIEGLNEFKSDMLSILKEIVQSPRFEESDIEFVKKQIHSAHKSLKETSTRDYINVLANQATFPEGHPYGYGRYTDLSDEMPEITADNLKALYAQLFNQPDMTVSAVGDVNHEEMTTFVADLVEPLSSTAVQQPEITVDPLTQDRVTTFQREGMAQAEIMRSWHVPGLKDEDKAAMAVLDRILTGGMSTRLFQIYRELPEKPLAYTARSRFNPALNGGTFQFYIGTGPENITLVQEMFQNEIDDLINNLPSDEEFNRAKELIKSITLRNSQKTADVSQYLANHRALDVDAFEEQLQQVNDVTPEDVKRVAQKYLSKPSDTVVMAPASNLKEHNLPEGQ